MSIDPAIPDYELADRLEVTAPAQLRALADPLRGTILELVLERAATVAELAAAVERPKSTVAHHVNVLVDAGMLRVVRTRRVRAIDERYYGRTARVIYVGALDKPSDNPMTVDASSLSVAATEAAPAHEADDLRAFHRHARISLAQVGEFWQKVEPLVREFSELPRSGDTVYGFVVGLYPTEFPTLPPPDGAQTTGDLSD